MLISVIIPTYKDIEALELILDALSVQTYTNFEVVVAEDNNSDDVKYFLECYAAPFKIKHYSQEDRGWRKAKAMNGAILLSTGEYLIFFDGDCIPYSKFIESHLRLSEKSKVLCGRRVNTGDKITKMLRNKEINISFIENSFFLFLLRFRKDRARHVEEGFYLNPDSFIYDFFIKILDKKKTLVGCNFSLFKNDILKINGFDESYPTGDVADDVDIEWRLNAVGVRNKSCRYAANLIHLNHSRKDRHEAHKLNYVAMLRKKDMNLFYCQDGIVKIS